VFAGDGLGGGLRLDAGRNLEVLGHTAFLNVGLGAMYRRHAPVEWRFETTTGLDLTDRWQMGLGYAATLAPGAWYEPGAYEKHELQAWLRWRVDSDYAISVSVTQVIAADRTDRDTVFRIGLWSFIYPEPDEPS
jgi:hypothetical protein